MIAQRLCFHPKDMPKGVFSLALECILFISFGHSRLFSILNPLESRVLLRKSARVRLLWCTEPWPAADTGASERSLI
jgi:hypothetical protein